MKIEQQNFEQLVERAMTNEQASNMRPVIEKESLHYDILFALEKGGFLDNLVFQGGTSLRLCYGGNRFSEDLDFAGGKDFSAKTLAEMKACIEKYVGTRYGLEVTVKEPKKLKEELKYEELKIDKWQIAVATASDKKHMPKQKIKVEVTNIPAYTKEPLPLQLNYDFLPDGYSDTLILTETLDEVMADKLVSLAATQKYVRHRDIWDLAWLKQQGATVKPELVSHKLNDYKITDFHSMLSTKIEQLPKIVVSQEFIQEMKRFIPTNVFDRTLGQEKFTQYLINTITGMLKELDAALYGDELNPEFSM